MSRRTGRRVGSTVGLATGFILGTGRAAAHGTALSEFQAPLPLAFLLAGAGTTVAATAVLLVAVGRAPERRVTVVDLPDAAVDRLRTVARLAFLLAVAAALGHGVVGPQAATDNLATVFVWPVWVMGVAIVAVVAGSPWRTLSPWRTVYDGLCRLEGAELGDHELPVGVGVWPAVVGFVLLIGYAENLTAVVRSPAATAGLVALYGLAMIGGSLVFGRRWFRRADPLEVFYELLGRVAAIAVVNRGGPTLVLRPPWLEPSRPVASGGHAALVVAAVYTVSFDGFVETRAFQDAVFGTRSILPLGSGTTVVLYLVGLLAFLATFVAVARLTGRGAGFDAPVSALAATIVPIAAAYQVAHTYPFVIANLGSLPAVVGGHGVDLMGWLTVPAFWASQVGLIVGGHLVAVVAAHRAIDRRLADDRRRLVGHAPVTLLMVGYTVLSLWIVSRPVLA